MDSDALDLTAPEAAVALAVLVSFSDDKPTEAEGVVLRKYYRYATAEALQGKLSAAGYTYPTDLPDAEETIVRAIGKAPVPFRLRSLAVAWLLALADGTVDHGELRLLSRYADALGVALADARRLADVGIPEIDERTENELETEIVAAPQAVPEQDLPQLTAVQAGISLVCEVAFSDDDPSNAEAAVLREFYNATDVEAFIATMNDAGYTYPDGLPQLKPAVVDVLGRLSRDEQLRLLAIAYRAASADGRVNAPEVDIIRDNCEDFGLGIAEVETFFKSDPV